MHERSVVRALLRQVEALAAKQRPSRVVAIVIRVGEFSGVEAELLKSAFDDLVADTTLRGAELVVERGPLEAVCLECGNSFHIDDFRFACTSCGSDRLKLTGGEELQLQSLVMEESYDKAATCTIT